MNIPLLKQLSETPGVPGREERVREVLRKEAKGLFDEITVDTMGSLICTKRGKTNGGGKGKAGGAGKAAPRVLFACHMDEIGFYVRHIDDKGFVRIANVGGFDTRNLLARRVRIQAKDGDLIGLMNPGGRPIHIAKDEDKKKVPEIGDFFIDLCLPADQVKAKVRIGDPVTLIQEFAEIGNCVTGKCLDNRVATFAILEAMRKVKRSKYDIVVAFTVQEEVGLRGAGPAAFAIEPDLAIAIDTTLCVDTPGVPDDERVSKQGEGVVIKIADGSAIADRPLVDDFVAVAQENKIPFQLGFLARGGTDTGAMQRTRNGVRAMSLCVPTRYIHTVTESIHKKDLQSAIDLVAAWLQA
ncbi:MAG TPA: M20/M25/M40 family metallo-hydrolase [Tepidisphaeraceae bacterium]|jgi:endoglucanase|nr:M20/M25/M40 family metallo-hydrolase [Tepidisphaeraceae bacterium]